MLQIWKYQSKGKVVTVCPQVSSDHVDRLRDTNSGSAELHLQGWLTPLRQTQFSPGWTTTSRALFKKIRAFLVIPWEIRRFLISGFLRTSTSGSEVDVLQRGAVSLSSSPGGFISIHIQSLLLYTTVAQFWKLDHFQILTVATALCLLEDCKHRASSFHLPCVFITRIRCQTELYYSCAVSWDCTYPCILTIYVKSRWRLSCGALRSCTFLYCYYLSRWPCSLYIQNRLLILLQIKFF